MRSPRSSQRRRVNSKPLLRLHRAYRALLRAGKPEREARL
jgi:hypothetical protein